jgi:succinate dehydrogenase / fumarate reductase cytochrome b subunit
MAQSALLKSSIAKKKWLWRFQDFFNAVLSTAFFINITSVFSPDTFNLLSHFMGNNFVQYVIQPILIVGDFSLYNGFVLDYKIEKHDR